MNEILTASPYNHTKLLIKTILEHPENHKWSVQGFGMFRLYLSDEVRLHLWDNEYKVKDVTEIHTHPWNFLSEVIVGNVHNIKYKVCSLTEITDNPVDEVTIKCGEGACLVSDTRAVFLKETDNFVVISGKSYFQVAEEIHSSHPEDGTITLVTRTMRQNLPRDNAKVYCVLGVGFVSAEPRPATYEEISGAARRSLERWF